MSSVRSKGLAVIRVRSLFICVITIAVLGGGGGAAAAQACSISWNGGSGSWGSAGNWTPAGVPGSTDDVCITAPGSDVTLGGAGANVNSLTLGGASGTATLEVTGQDYDDSSNEIVNSTSLVLNDPSTIGSGGQLILDATGGGPSISGNQVGGSAILYTSSLTNSGQIVAQADDPSWQEYFEGALTNESSGSIDVNSGTLTLPSPNGGGIAPSYNYAITNDGSLSVASGASLVASVGDGSTGEITNDGPVTNSGTIRVVNGGGQMTWNQSGGSITGNAVQMQNGAWLVDAAGAGAFLFNSAGGAISGTIPSGQTVTVQGEPFSSGGETYNSTTLALNAGGSASPVMNNGTLVLDAPGTSPSTGGNTYLTSGTLDNNGTVTSQVEDTTWENHLEANIANGTAGSLDVNSGTLITDATVTTSNDGTVTIAPGAAWQLEEGGTLANAATGTLIPEIASASSFGKFQLTSPCCNGPGTVTAGGTLAPRLVGGFTPAPNQEFDVFGIGGKFSGTFGSLGSGFTADYAHEASTPAAFVGVVYDKTGPSALTVTAITSAKGKLQVSLRCSKGTGACAPARIAATITEHFNGSKLTAVTARASSKAKVVTIASAMTTLASGGSRTVTIAPDAAGRALLARFHKLAVLTKVTVAGKAVKSRKVTLRPAAKPKKKSARA